jgi:hypothetical protein
VQVVAVHEEAVSGVPSVLLLVVLLLLGRRFDSFVMQQFACCVFADLSIRMYIIHLCLDDRPVVVAVDG